MLQIVISVILQWRNLADWMRTVQPLSFRSIVHESSDDARVATHNTTHTTTTHQMISRNRPKAVTRVSLTVTHLQYLHPSNFNKFYTMLFVTFLKSTYFQFGEVIQHAYVGCLTPSANSECIISFGSELVFYNK